MFKLKLYIMTHEEKNIMTNKKALLHLWESVDKNSIYQLSYIRNLALELGEKELYFMFRDFKQK